MFGEAEIGETPATDPKTLVGRNVSVSLAELIGNPTKLSMRVEFKIDDVHGKNLSTSFHGYEMGRDQLLRVVRKRSQKIEYIDTFSTKDDWKLQITTVMILNNSACKTVQTGVRNVIKEYLKELATNSGMDEFMNAVVSGVAQRTLKKKGNMLYPIRFSEITKIEVVKRGK